MKFDIDEMMKAVEANTANLFREEANDLFSEIAVKSSLLTLTLVAKNLSKDRATFILLLNLAWVTPHIEYLYERHYLADKDEDIWKGIRKKALKINVEMRLFVDKLNHIDPYKNFYDNLTDENIAEFFDDFYNNWIKV